jgi:hypothetical protein
MSIVNQLRSQLLELKFLKNLPKIPRLRGTGGTTYVRVPYNPKNGKSIRSQMIKYWANLPE